MSDQPSLTPLGKLVIALFALACIGGGFFLLSKGDSASGEATSAPAASTSPADREATITLGIAYGTEKKRWLLWAAEEFAKTEAGQRISLDLIPMGSVEGAKAIVAGDERIHVWSPASAAYRDTFEQDWQIKHNSQPILSAEDLALSPMVFVMWKKRYQAFIEQYGSLTFQTLRQATTAPGGWADIANKPEWGYFKFGHTNPKESNSGVLALVLTAYDYHDKHRALKLADILDPGFQEHFRALESTVTGLPHSTGTLMHEMILKGPSAYDAVLVYENLAMSYFENAKGRSGELTIVYPEKNMWNANPYYILDAPWSSSAQRQAAETFRDFLLSENIQAHAVTEGFRPANVQVPYNTPDSPFTRYQAAGIKNDIPTVCEPPSADVLHNLILGWERLRASR
ncbi:MAG: substrate-binding domain-containing protein [Verrucomicrobiales bacterium]